MHNPKSVEFHQCHAKRHSICFLPQYQITDNERNLCQDLLTTENIDSDLKVHGLHYANEVLARVRLSFQNLLQTRSKCRNNTKKWLGKELGRVVVVDKSTDHVKTHINLFFYHNINTKENVFLFSERESRCALLSTTA